MAVRPPGFGRAGADQRAQARAQLLDAALRLFVERGYVAVRVEDIARTAGISRATFYKHFAEREEILAELFVRLLGHRAARPPGGPAEAVARIRTLLIDAVTTMVANERLARFVYTLPIRHATFLGEGARPPVLDTVQELVVEGSAAGVFRADVSTEMITEHLGRVLEAAMRDWAEGRAPDAASRLEALLDLALNGAVRPAGGDG